MGDRAGDLLVAVQEFDDELVQAQIEDRLDRGVAQFGAGITQQFMGMYLLPVFKGKAGHVGAQFIVTE